MPILLGNQKVTAFNLSQQDEDVPPSREDRQTTHTLESGRPNDPPMHPVVATSPDRAILPRNPSNRSTYHSAAGSLQEIDDDDDDDNDDNNDPHHPATDAHPRQHSSPQGCGGTGVHHLHYARRQVGAFVNHPTVQLFIVVLISINALMMGVATFEFVKNDPDMANAFEITDQVFLIIFTVELCAQFIFHGWRLFQDGWLVFDTIIIVTSWSSGEAQIIRAFRIFRALRLITRIAVMQNLVLGEENCCVAECTVDWNFDFRCMYH